MRMRPFFPCTHAHTTRVRLPDLISGLPWILFLCPFPSFTSSVSSLSFPAPVPVLLLFRPSSPASSVLALRTHAARLQTFIIIIGWQIEPDPTPSLFFPSLSASVPLCSLSPSFSPNKQTKANKKLSTHECHGRATCGMHCLDQGSAPSSFHGQNILVMRLPWLVSFRLLHELTPHVCSLSELIRPCLMNV